MEQLYMKIHRYEEESRSLIVSFASDETAHQDPDQYRALAYQPLNMWPGVEDIEEIKKRLAVAGLWVVEQQAREESFVADENKIQQFKQLAGQTFAYQAQDLIPPAPSDQEPIVDV
jgi:hypothetical protein